MTKSPLLIGNPSEKAGDRQHHPEKAGSFDDACQEQQEFIGRRASESVAQSNGAHSADERRPHSQSLDSNPGTDPKCGTESCESRDDQPGKVKPQSQIDTDHWY